MERMALPVKVTLQVLTVELRGPAEPLEGLSSLSALLTRRQRLRRIGARARTRAISTDSQSSSEEQLHRVGAGREGGEDEDSQRLWNEQIRAEVEDPPMG